MDAFAGHEQNQIVHYDHGEFSERSTHFIEGSQNVQLQAVIARLIIAPAKVL